MGFARTLLVLLVLAGVFVCGSVKPSIFDEQTGDWDDLQSLPMSAHLPKPSDSWKSPSTEIFVGISHYRDGRCSETLKNLFEKAKNPERVHVGIIAHIHTEEDKMNCKRDYCRSVGHGLDTGRCPHAERISQIDVSFKDARAPGISRYMQQQLQGDQEFCLQVDAHSDFVSHWDMAMLETWSATRNEYAILSTKPPNLGELNSANGEVNHVCGTSFSSSGIPRNLLPRRARGLTTPLLAPLWSASFSFSKCHAMRKAPYDPNLPYIFAGEEFLQTAKLWTRGYDVYSPNRVLVAHDYDGKMKGYQVPTAVQQRGSHVPADKAWATNGQTPEYKRVMYDEAVERIKTILDMEGGHTATPETLAAIQRYGLGAKRKLDDFFMFTGVDTRQGILFADACKARAWVPFVIDSDPNVDDMDIWGLAPEVLFAGDSSVPLLAEGNVELISPSTASDSAITKVDTPIADAAFVVLEPSHASQTENPLQQYPLLWGLFLPVDSALESIVGHVQDTNNQGRGASVRFVKLALLILPVAILLVALAVITALGKSVDDCVGTDTENRRPALTWDEDDELGKRI